MLLANVKSVRVFFPPLRVPAQSIFSMQMALLNVAGDSDECLHMDPGRQGTAAKEDSHTQQKSAVLKLTPAV